jgi:hypothetical protein
MRGDADTAEENRKGADKHSSSANDHGAVGKVVITLIYDKDGVDICWQWL